MDTAALFSAKIEPPDVADEEEDVVGKVPHVKSEEPIPDDDDSNHRSTRVAKIGHIKKIVTAKYDAIDDIINYHIEWEDEDMVDTWELSEHLSISEPAKALLAQFQATNAGYKAALAKQEKAHAKKGRAAGGRRSGRKQKGTFSYVEENDDEPEIFFGQAPEALTGELRQLYDPTHKFTETELILAQTPTETNARTTRSQVRARQSNRDDSASRSGPPSRTTTPQPSAPDPSSPSHAATPTTGRGRGRGRGRGGTTAAARKPKAPSGRGRGRGRGKTGAASSRLVSSSDVSMQDVTVDNDDMQPMDDDSSDVVIREVAADNDDDNSMESVNAQIGALSTGKEEQQQEEPVAVADAHDTVMDDVEEEEVERRTVVTPPPKKTSGGKKKEKKGKGEEKEKEKEKKVAKLKAPRKPRGSGGGSAGHKRAVLDDEDDEVEEREAVAVRTPSPPPVVQKPPRALVGRRMPVNWPPNGCTVAPDGESLGEAISKTQSCANHRLTLDAERLLTRDTVKRVFTDAVYRGDMMTIRRCHTFCNNNHINLDHEQVDIKDGTTLLHRICTRSCTDPAGTAYQHGLCDVAEYLVLKGSDPGRRDNSGRSPVIHAIEKGGVCRVRRLLALRGPVNSYDLTTKEQAVMLIDPVFAAYMKNSKPLMRLLLEAGACTVKLESQVRQHKLPIQGRAWEEIQKHRVVITRRFVDAQKAVMQFLTVIKPITPIFTSNIFEGPEFNIAFTYNVDYLPDSSYMFVLFVATARVEEGGKWFVRMFGGGLNKDPTLNGEDTQQIQYLDTYGPVNGRGPLMAPCAYLCTPAHGFNELKMTVNQSLTPFANTRHLLPRLKLLTQICICQRDVPTHDPNRHRQPILEHAPNNPSSYY